MTTEEETIGVLCVDDNPHVADALRLKLSRTELFRWTGWLPSADSLVEEAKRTCPALVLLDVDMPGRDPFDAAAELVEVCPETRIVVFSGHVRQELIDKALDAGVWGYVSKNDGEEELLKVLRLVAGGEVGFSPEVRQICDLL